MKKSQRLFLPSSGFSLAGIIVGLVLFSVCAGGITYLMVNVVEARRKNQFADLERAYVSAQQDAARYSVDSARTDVLAAASGTGPARVSTTVTEVYSTDAGRTGVSGLSLAATDAGYAGSRAVAGGLLLVGGTGALPAVEPPAGAPALLYPPLFSVDGVVDSSKTLGIATPSVVVELKDPAVGDPAHVNGAPVEYFYQFKSGTSGASAAWTEAAKAGLDTSLGTFDGVSAVGVFQAWARRGAQTSPMATLRIYGELDLHVDGVPVTGTGMAESKSYAALAGGYPKEFRVSPLPVEVFKIVANPYSGSRYDLGSGTVVVHTLAWSDFALPESENWTEAGLHWQAVAAPQPGYESYFKESVLYDLTVLPERAGLPAPDIFSDSIEDVYGVFYDGNLRISRDDASAGPGRMTITVDEGYHSVVNGTMAWTSTAWWGSHASTALTGTVILTGSYVGGTGTMGFIDVPVNP